MDILLTGATGFIGRHLGTALTSKHRVFGLTKRQHPQNSKGIIWLNGDLTSPGFVDILPQRIDAILCLSQSRSYRSFPDQAADIFNVNVAGTQALLEYARQVGISKFFYASTANVYRQSNQRISEDFSIEPTTFYARSKRMAEMLVESYADFFRCTVLRFFTVYGPGQKDMLIPNLVERVRNGQPLQVQGKHGFKTSPIYVDDISCIFRELIEQEQVAPGFDVLNVGGDEMLGIFELGVLIGEALQVMPHFTYSLGDEPPGWIADNSKLKTVLGNVSFTSFSEGIRQMITKG